MDRRRIVILGGGGVFGSRVIERLLRSPDLDIVAAGRHAARTRAVADALSSKAGRRVGHAILDATSLTASQLASVGAGVLVNATGPFQAQDYSVATAAIGAGVHYLDLADARAFVTGIAALDAAAHAAGVLVVSGASSVPGLSAAVVDHFAKQFARLRGLSLGISPGNSFDPGVATTASIIGGLGRPFSMRIDGAERTFHGWQGLSRHVFPGLGRRWLAACDVPDLALFPARHPGMETVRFAAGVEVPLFHFGMWALSWPGRLGLLRSPDRLARALLAVKRGLRFLGSDRGGMFVTLAGQGSDGRPKRIDWHLVAGSGHGPYVPAMAAVVIARKLARGDLAERGAMPCLGLFTLDEFLAEVADLDIRATAEVSR